LILYFFLTLLSNALTGYVKLMVADAGKCQLLSALDFKNRVESRSLNSGLSVPAATIEQHWLLREGITLRETLNKAFPFMVRQAHHERKKRLAVRSSRLRSEQALSLSKD
jgi:hypothetical protein